jgi:predicted XRE-type DNA-binding protein/tetratricopeptide (TPR) repeat protein
MEARSLPEAFKLIMEQRRCSQNQLARELKKGQGWVSDVINGKAGLEFAKMIKFLSRVGWEVVIRPKREEFDPMKRREFHQRAITVAAVSAVEAARSAVFIPSPKVGPFGNAEYVRVLAGRLLHDLREIGGVPLASIALGHVQRIEKAGDGKGRTLRAAEAELLANTSLILFDARRVDQAERAAAVALGLARESGDRIQQVRASKYLNTYATHSGHYGRAAMYVQRALKIPELEEIQRAELSAQRALSLAMGRGDTNTVREMLDQARATGYSGDTVAGYSGLAFHHLGEHDAAISSLGSAVELFERYSPTDGALWLATRVKVTLATEKPPLDLAIPDMLILARLYPLVASAHLAELVVSILKASYPWNTSEGMRDARDQLREVGPRSAQQVKWSFWRTMDPGVLGAWRSKINMERAAIDWT